MAARAAMAYGAEERGAVCRGGRPYLRMLATRTVKNKTTSV
jgi:hypothetical protein